MTLKLTGIRGKENLYLKIGDTNDRKLKARGLRLGIARH
jgi:hypothetical protein